MLTLEMIQDAKKHWKALKSNTFVRIRFLSTLTQTYLSKCENMQAIILLQAERCLCKNSKPDRRRSPRV